LRASRRMEADTVLASRLWPILRGSPGCGERLRMTVEFFRSSTLNFSNLIPVPRTSLILLASCSRGALHEASGVGQDAAPAAVPRKHRLGSPGFPSGPNTGVCHRSWLDGDRRAARNRQESSPRKNGPGLKTPRRSVERRCRVPLFPGDPGNKPRPLPRCAFRRPVSPQKGRSTRTPTRAAARERRCVAV
jgi:hypothetical protein